MIMKLMVLTAAVFPTENDARQKMWVFLKSCGKSGIDDLHLYGIGHGFPGYRFMKLELQLAYLKEHKDDGYTHVLYTDGWDAMFTGPLTEIIEKYEFMGRPPFLSSACYQLGNVSRMDPYKGCFNEDDYYRYPCVGGYMAELPVVIDMFERMLKLPRQTGDDCFNWYDAWAEGWFRPILDRECQIFQVTDDNCEAVGLITRRVYNQKTGSYPCVLHLSGGYTDQITGKDRVMVPWAKNLGIIE